jgi:NAD(P)-dependent dehydrogenase (short-subunit alcohol dehydrogenase family)
LKQLAEVWRRDSFDYLVNNAGFADPTMFEDMTEAPFDRYRLGEADDIGKVIAALLTDE